MFKRILLVLLLLVAVLFGAQLNRLRAKDAAPNNWKSLVMSYAEANLALAEARLAQAKGQNQLVAGSVSEETVDQLEAGVKLTRSRLQQLQKGPGSAPYAPEIAAAEDDLRGLQADHDESIKANKIQAGSVSEPELRREQAEIDVAKARLATLKVLAQQPAEVQIKWEIAQLQDQDRALWARPLIED
jgi:hypothetical protein